MTHDQVLARVRDLYPGAVTLNGYYSGGNDSGGYEQWYVMSGDPLVRTDIPYDAVGIVRNKERDWETVNADGKVVVSLSELLENAFQDAHGYYSFAGEFEVSGTVEIDIKTGRVLSNHGSYGATHYEDF